MSTKPSEAQETPVTEALPAKWCCSVECPERGGSGAAGHDHGRWSVAGPRMPDATDNLVAIIRSLDGTLGTARSPRWNSRPFNHFSAPRNPSNSMDYPMWLGESA
jgi:hypothetical protein